MFRLRPRHVTQTNPLSRTLRLSPTLIGRRSGRRRVRGQLSKLASVATCGPQIVVGLRELDRLAREEAERAIRSIYHGRRRLRRRSQSRIRRRLRSATRKASRVSDLSSRPSRSHANAVRTSLLRLVPSKSDPVRTREETRARARARRSIETSRDRISLALSPTFFLPRARPIVLRDPLPMKRRDSFVRGPSFRQTPTSGGSSPRRLVVVADRRCPTLLTTILRSLLALPLNRAPYSLG